MDTVLAVTLEEVVVEVEVVEVEVLVAAAVEGVERVAMELAFKLGLNRICFAL